MTPQEIDRIEKAIRHIQSSLDVDPWAAEIAVEAMRKQIPKKPMKSIDLDYKNLYRLSCPTCGKYIAYVNSRVGTLNKWTMVCGFCGQAIDWDGE